MQLASVVVRAQVGQNNSPVTHNLAGPLVQGVLPALRDAPIKTQILELTARRVPRDGTLTSLAQAEYVWESVRVARMVPLALPT